MLDRVSIMLFCVAFSVVAGCSDPAADERAVAAASLADSQARKDAEHRAMMAQLEASNNVMRAELDAKCKAGGPCFVDVEGAGAWRVSTSTDPITDKIAHAVWLVAASTTGSRDRERLRIECSAKGKTDFYLSTDEYLGLDGQNVTARIDDGTPVVWWGSESTSHEALFFKGALASQLRKKTKLLLQYHPYGKGPITATFDISGIEPATEALARACKWR